MKISKSDIFDFILNGKILGVELGGNKDDLIKKLEILFITSHKKRKVKEFLIMEN